jgi:hypothetical protein
LNQPSAPVFAFNIILFVIVAKRERLQLEVILGRLGFATGFGPLRFEAA